MPLVKTWQLIAASAVAGLVLSAATVSAAGPWDSGQRKAERDKAASWSRTGGADHGSEPLPEAAPSAPAVLSGLPAARRAGKQAGRQSGSGSDALAEALRPLLADPALGAVRAASVVDTATGQVLYEAKPREAMTPASTTKIATATAALAALGPEHRFRTTVTPGAGPGQIILVGGGDPSLTARKKPPAGSGGSLVALAADTAQALKAAGTDSVSLGYDDSLYSGPARHPIGLNPNIALLTALTADEARTNDSLSGPVARFPDPSGETARAFAELLKERGIKVTAAPAKAKAAADAEPLATTLSTPLGGLVERMLTNSDNDIAEALARQTALASGQPGSFEGGEKAVAARLAALGIDTTGSRFADGSGLDRADKVSAGLLTALLAKAADPQRPELRPVLTGLPVAGFSGTLRGRGGGDSPAAGLIRAKTGTLSGVNSLAGTVVDPSGRLLAFAFLTADTPGPEGAERALDKLAATVASTR
ncbi:MULTISPECIES: D-alanyl-D-alanine carboxypeptidase/D-alanyl-D-alanine-endopeptidase [unclassified Streptomyces]|uniref:D-alanyl-D-alanine carboxypeptidase/D-alanyl-D-alanine endopeptidase n=1 Tax=unclassified Streptomyces TaxID=2593676 RepID=UPI00225AD54F|nr:MULTISPECIES: D-alanyl-D-alanine carboxypeptidase/D-alanyl-D-alanine-endopeptidase [unclassified Streptomyces]MCX4527280.1 D-alanyl-D-alanine carboxypeptidase/D-alanyl-D-alanine-endopeptidase [Streptomyces sp. NBC_01551]MCX4542140.1 D-alanyl-D-alanine carboxypeptidase/D-alanyl-D-alanine-endopeptidase [Streptomyces sp. NBC_01565]